MRIGAWGVLLGGVAALLLQTGAAAACGATAPPFYIVQEQAPTSTTAPLNTPLVVTLVPDTSGPVAESFNPTLTLMRGGSADSIELKSLGGLLTLTWVPVAPLDAETSYEAHFNPGYEGIPDTIWTFTTGTESTPPLSLEGALEVTLESGTDTVLQCPAGAQSKCGPDTAAGCKDVEIEVTKARVKIPRATGGFAARSGALWLTDDLPYDFSRETKSVPPPYQGKNVSLAQYADLDDANVVDVLITLPTEEVAYQPCFAFAASDGRGDEAFSEPLCLDQPIPPLADEGTGGSAATPGGLGNDIKKPPQTSEGCSMSHGQRARHAWLAALALLGLLRRNRDNPRT